MSDEIITLRNDSFIIRCDTREKNKEPCFALKKFQVNFTSHSEEIYYEEKQHSRETIRNFVFDYKRQMLILLIRDSKLKSKGVMLFKIIDCITSHSLI